MKMPASKKEQYLTVQSVAERLSCTDHYVYALIRDGKLIAIKIGERALRITESSFDRFVSANIVNPDDYFAPIDMEQGLKSKVHQGRQGHHG